MSGTETSKPATLRTLAWVGFVAGVITVAIVVITLI
jgi:hypothetical protein